MSASTDPDHFFQTTTSLESTTRRAAKSKNKNGNPITLPSKILAITPDPTDDNFVYAAESAGTVKRLDLTSRSVTATYKGPTAPLTSLAFSSNGRTLFAGCWDKSIWSWNIFSLASANRYLGHTDFVKAILVIPAPYSPTSSDLLVSGSANSELIFWDTESGTRLHVLKGHTRGVQALALDPPSDPDTCGHATLISADNVGKLYTCSLKKPPSGPLQTPKQALQSLTLSKPTPVHETTIYALHLSSSSTLYTASADKTCKSFPSPTSLGTPDLVLNHPDFIYALTPHDRLGLLLTACRDEEIRVWNTATGSLIHTFSGHFDAVMGVCLAQSGDVVVSAGCDGTVRTWEVGKGGLGRAVEEAKRKREEGKEEGEERVGGAGGGGGLTEEEERELAELMGEE
ncbi:MAG: hypothetical protein Q9227_004647 [Pyrenula ochraceoflavens]